jgi:hypothetical protein
MTETKNSGLVNGLGISSLVLGILTLIVSMIPCFGIFAILIGVLALIICIAGLVIAFNQNASKGVLIAAFILLSIGIAIALYQYKKLHDFTSNSREIGQIIK